MIGHDVWIGHNAIILPSVDKIETGAIIGAGAVIHRDVPPYSVYQGNPARLIKKRFADEKIEDVLQSKWWEKSIDELKGQLEEFRNPLPRF
ncbi:MAG: hypothetical protein WHT06_05120 [Desulfobacterales bacterium]